MIDVDAKFPAAVGKDLLPLVDGPVELANTGPDGAVLRFVPPVDRIEQPPPMCFENHWQPQYSPAICEAPLKVKTLYLPVVHDARLVGNGLVVARNGALLNESIGRHAVRLGLQADGESAYRLGRALRMSVHRAQKAGIPNHDGPALMLFDPAIHRFGMWMLKCLTKLSVLPLLKETDVRIVVPFHVPDFYLAIMEDLGVAPERMVFHDPAGVSTFRQLLIPPKTYTFTATRYGNPFEVFRYPDDRTGGRLRLPASPKRRIYVSRRDIPRRQLVNEADVEAVFREFDFHCVAPASLTAPQTISLFADCRFIAGPHGSGLYNGMFSRHALRGIQIVPPRLKFENAFLILSHVCSGKGGSAGYVFGRMHEDRRSLIEEFDYTWEVDVHRLRAVLADLF